jgi:glucan phosphoethanolaminetransferase (alkaline phosphatase superfamily)
VREEQLIMKKINFKKIILLVGLYFTASLLTQYFINDSMKLTGVFIGAIVFAVFIFVAELLSKKE